MAEENIELHVVHNPNITNEDNGFAVDIKIDGTYKSILSLSKTDLLKIAGILMNASDKFVDAANKVDKEINFAEANKVFTIEVPSSLATEDVHNFVNTCKKMCNLYAKKNHDYGNSFDKGMNVIGMAYGVGRLYDKINRLINLTNHTENVSEVHDESIEDTIIDLACYSVMLINNLNNK
jgi:hypothetical protein